MKILFIFPFLLISLQVWSQPNVLSDPQAVDDIEEQLNLIYNFRFESFETYYQEIQTKDPNHPLPWLFHSIKIYWEHFPVTPESDFHQTYVDYISDAIEKSDALLKKDKDNTEASFISLVSRLLLMQYYADNHQSSKVIPYVRKAYQLTKAGFDLTDNFVDFNFSTGLYNYYIEAYPEKHPVYKPIAYFFPKGNKELGLKQLEYTWKHGIFLDAEALSFLVYISLNFEGDYRKSARYTRMLYQEYPNNPLYLSYRIRTLLLLERYHRAEQLVDELEDNPFSNNFFQMMIEIYRGILQEKKYKNYSMAEQHYRNAVQLSEKYVPFANGRLSYAYFGLSRIWEHKNKKQAADYRDKALELSIYKHLTFD